MMPNYPFRIRPSLLAAIMKDSDEIEPCIHLLIINGNLRNTLFSSSMRCTKLLKVERFGWDLCSALGAYRLKKRKNQINNISRKIMTKYFNQTYERIFESKFYTSNFDMSFKGKWVPRLHTRGTYLIFHIKCDGEVKYFKYYKFV